MSQKFYKGRTNNHLTWVMVDATDFATPESAASAATTIKIYGKLRGQAAHNFVSSGTGSLTNDIQHVGASATGIYTLALAKADLSDASAAWYDQYIIALSCTGCARQTLVVDGGIDDSEILSQLLLTLSGASDAASAAAQANSRVLLVQSRLSDLDSRLVSDLSDVLSAAQQTNSRVLLNQSRISDIASYLVVMSDVLSNVYSLVSNINSATLVAADVSDFASAVWAEKYTANSAASSFGSLFSDIYSRVLLNQSRVSDIQSYLVAMSGALSDVDSAVNSQYSDLASKIGNVSVTITASDISDIASAVAAAVGSTISDTYSAVIVIQSRLSDLDSRLVSDISDVLSQLTVIQSMASDAHSAAILAASHASDAHSAALLAASAASDAHSAAVVTQSMASDIYSLLSDVASDITVISGVVSDIRSDISRGVDIRAINGTTVVGDGAGIPWGPA
jgi:hypothetical protein